MNFKSFYYIAMCLFLASPVYSLTKDNILLVYREGSPSSTEVAQYYQEKRGLADVQLFAISPTFTGGRSMLYEDYKNEVEIPVMNRIEELKNNYGYDIQVILLSCTLPTVVSGSTTNATASLDSELAVGRTYFGSGLDGYFLNPYYNWRRFLRPFNSADNQGMLLVMRLDGPALDAIKALVDNAIEAENGVSGKGYFDAWPNYPFNTEPNKSIIQAYDLFKDAGFESYIEKTGALMKPPKYSGKDALFYYGWYDGGQEYLSNGDHFEWNPGAIGTHLYSGGAYLLDLRHGEWCPYMILRGVSGTQGSIHEGYTLAYSEAYYMLLYMLHGFSYAEAAYVSNVVVSWKQIFIGDPLLKWPKSSLPSPLVSTISATPEGIKISWRTVYNFTYIVEYSDGDANGELSNDAVFVPIPASMRKELSNPGQGEEYTDYFATHPLPAHGKRFYRVKLVD